MTGVAGPPFADKHMADAIVSAPGRLRYASDRLTAHVEAMLRGGDYYGFIVTSPKRMSIWGASVLAYGQSASQLRIYYYKRPPAPALAARLATATPGAAPAAPAR